MVLEDLYKNVAAKQFDLKTRIMCKVLNVHIVIDEHSGFSIILKHSYSFVVL